MKPHSTIDVVRPTTGVEGAVLRFSASLWRAANARPGNLALSPASLFFALAMTERGASGDTQEEMRRTLSWTGDDDALHVAGSGLIASLDAKSAAHTLRIANRLFGEASYRFEPEFLAAVETHYSAPLEAIRFRGSAAQGIERINSWVADATEQRIPDIVDEVSVNDETRLVLVNAAYFLGEWLTPFAAEATKEEAFFVDGERAERRPTMRHQGHFLYGEVPDAQVLELDYRGDRFAMTFVLPRAKDGLGAIEARLSEAELARFTQGLTHRAVAVTLPRFRIEMPKPIELREALQKMGMRDAFDRQRASFHRMANPPKVEDRLYIAHVLHRALVRVDEMGTEAAAATAVVLIPLGGPPPAQRVVFRADHPFLFLLRDRQTGAILFMGRVTDPA